jgi:hypothetical protein
LKPIKKNIIPNETMITMPNASFEKLFNPVLRTMRNENKGVRNIPNRKASPVKSKKLISFVY